jgi:hypothetical protein
MKLDLFLVFNLNFLGGLFMKTLVYSCLIFLCFVIATIIERNEDYDFSYIVKQICDILSSTIGLGLSALLLIHLIFQTANEVSFLKFTVYFIFYCLDYIFLFIIFLLFCHKKIRCFTFNKNNKLGG